MVSTGIGEELTFEDYGNVGTLRDYLKALRVRPDFPSGQVRSILLTRELRLVSFDREMVEAAQALGLPVHD